MKLYFHPASTTSRVVWLFALDQGVELDYQVVDLFAGEHMKPEFAKINPNCMVPVLEDGDFRLTECSAILKYLGDKTDSSAYPKDLKKRARVHEMMDWFNSNFYRDWGYGLIYPQLFPHLKREDAKVQEAVVAWGKEKSKAWLQVLNDHWIGPNNKYLCGNQLTIADYFGAAITTAGELIHCDFSAYPNIKRWLDNFKAGPNYAKVYETFTGFCASTKGQPWQAI